MSERQRLGRVAGVANNASHRPAGRRRQHGMFIMREEIDGLLALRRHLETLQRLDRGGLTVSRDRGADYGSTVTQVDQGHQSREPLAGLEVIREHSPVLEIAR